MLSNLFILDYIMLKLYSGKHYHNISKLILREGVVLVVAWFCMPSQPVRLHISGQILRGINKQTKLIST